MAKLDIGDHLMALLESDRNQEKEQKLKQEILQLQTRANKLKNRTDNLQKDLIRNINANKNDSRGQMQPIKISKYVEHEDHSKSQNSNEVDSKDILDSFRRSQVMQAYAICQGITAQSSSAIRSNSMATFSQNARLASYQFHPVSEKSGKIHGPFDIVLANKSKNENSIILFSYNLPEPGDATFKIAPKATLMTDRQKKINREESKKPVIPIDDLEEEYLKSKSKLREEKSDIRIDEFVRSVSDHISAYVSRMDQVQELLPKNGADKPECGEVYNVQYSRDVTKVTFILKIVDGSGSNGSTTDENEGDELLLTVSLKYEKDGRRPKPGCVSIRFSGSQKERYTKEDLETLENQCEVFYTETISNGIKAAFVEEVE